MFNTLKKSALSTSIALSLLGLGSIAQVQAQDLPNIDPIEFDTFEGDFEGNPLFIDVGSDTSLLSISEWYQIQAYAQGAIGLPNTEPELRAVTRFPESDEFTDAYRALLGDFQNVYTSGDSWNRTLYPNLVQLALDLANYGDTHAALIQPLITQLTLLQATFDPTQQENHRQAAIGLLNALTSFSNARAADTQAAIDSLMNFRADVEAQSVSLDQREVDFQDMLDEDRVSQLQADIQDLNSRISQANSDLSEAERNLGLSAIGGVLGLAIGGGVFGSQIAELKGVISDLNNQLDQAEADLEHAMHLAASYELARDKVVEIDGLIDAALPHIRTVLAHWQGIGSDFTNLKENLEVTGGDNGLGNANAYASAFLANVGLGRVQENWFEISQKARTFAQNAYVIVEVAED